MACLVLNDQRPAHFLVKQIFGDGGDMEFLEQLDLTELKFLVSIIRERMEGERH